MRPAGCSADAVAERIRWFPVRHHSPAAARLVRETIEDEPPEAVLIEGPSDFNDRIEELSLDHRLPIAIYSSVVLEGRGRAAAYHPLCVHSPEWQALRAGLAVGAAVSFIDLPWAAAAPDAAAANRYADSELLRSPALSLVCERLGVDDFDAAWDLLAEIDPELSLEEYVRRCELLCSELRGHDEHAVPDRDHRREAFMASRVRTELGQREGALVVVCGGFHLPALRRLVASDGPLEAEEPQAPQPGDGRVIALTPYSFEALDALTGYDAGMANPGFYDAVWHSRTGERGGEPPFRVVLRRIVERLRERGQHVSPADLIAVESTAGALAALRGHAEPWRTDLLDGVVSALVKDELELGVAHPMLEAAHEVLRGGERGRLAPGASRPPFVEDLNRALEVAGLSPEGRPRTVDLDLARGDEADLARSRLLHRLAVLGIPGFDALGVVSQSDELRERWTIRDDPGFDGAVVEAAGYGPTVAEAAAGRLLERLAGVERDAGAAAEALVEGALCGLGEVAGRLLARTRALVAGDPAVDAVTAALRAALRLYRFEPVLGAAGQAGYGTLVDACFDRLLWLLDTGGGSQAPEDAGVEGIAAALECWERCAAARDLGPADLVGVLGRVLDHDPAPPGLRGAALGALWNLDAASDDDVAGGPVRFADPERLGDFLHGMFRLAREPVQRRRDLVERIDESVMAFDGDDFLDALPALRRAFSVFTPREKDRLAGSFVGAGLRVPRTAEPETVAAMLALEGRLRGALRRYGIRRAPP